VHYYKRNIGDYYKKAGRLTMLEHGAYTLLMDACYDREQFPTAEQAIDWCGARGQDEIDAVNSVLAKFFSLKPNKTYFQQHISEVLSAYKEIGKQNKRIALQRESTKRARTVDDTLTQRSRTDHALAPNHKPLTTNQEPLTNTDSGKPLKAPLDYSSWPTMPEQQTLADWIAMRKRIKADVSQTVVNAFGKEFWLAHADGVTVDQCLSECIASNWRGFKFTWLKNREVSNAANQRPAHQTRGERNEQAFRDYIAGIDAQEDNGSVLAGLIGPATGN